MEILSDNERNLNFSWDIHPNQECYFSELKYVHRIEDLEAIIRYPRIRFDIRFSQNSTEELFDRIVKMLETERLSFSIVRPRIINDKVRIKEGRESHITKIKEINAEIDRKYQSAVEMLKSLDCGNMLIGNPKHQTIPDEYYEWKEIIDMTWAWISVDVYFGSNFYNFLRREGIFDKYFPDWTAYVI